MKLLAEALRYDLKGRPLVDGVTLAVGPGELVGLIGPNGAGKTTLLRLLAGLLPPTRGEVTHDGRVLGERERARRLAYLAQGETVHWALTVEHLVALGRLPHGEGSDSAAVARALRATGCEDLRRRSLDGLSGGERRRVLLARALAVEAELLLVDEPVAALDPYHQLQVMELLRRTARAGPAVVAVLHDLALAARFCDRLVLLRRGRVLADGRAAEVLSDGNLALAYGVTARRWDEGVVVPWERIGP